jgi:hypothetical protein
MKQRAIWSLVAASFAVAGLVAGIFALRMQHVVKISKAEVSSRNRIEFVEEPYAAGTLAFDVLSAPAEFKQAQLFQGNLYIAGPEGLIEYGSSAEPIRQFPVGQDLPSSPLVGLAQVLVEGSEKTELIVATADKGLLVYDGKSFSQIYPVEKQYRQITCVLGTERENLLIGTKQRGVLLFDGQRITALHPTLENVNVTALAGDETDLWVGTIDRGVLHWYGGETETFGEQQGMPDPHVLSIALQGETTYVGTAVGIGVFQRGKFSHLIAPNAFATALLATPQALIIGTEDQGVLTLPLKAASSQIQLPATREVQTMQVEQLFSRGSDVYALTAAALYRMNDRGLDWEQVLQRGPATLTDRNVSALAVDASGRLWIGYFNRGLDRIDGPDGPVHHIEDQHVFCVNRILPEAKSGAIDVATANGLVKFDSAGNEEQILTRADGLIADHVTDVAPYGEGLALATPAGLTFLDSHGARSVYVFQGLVNNHVYALGVSRDQLLAGTLGGISMFDREDVQANYTVANSGLKHNWITAVVAVGTGWMVGTYGAGVLGLDSDGRFYALGDATGPFDVNFNAMLVTPQHVLAGTLGQGFYAYSRSSQRWTRIAEGLPSSNVTAFAANGDYVYVGTDNGLVRIEEQRLP